VIPVADGFEKLREALDRLIQALPETFYVDRDEAHSALRRWWT
jgi:hypothetical protein